MKHYKCIVNLKDFRFNSALFGVVIWWPLSSHSNFFHPCSPLQRWRACHHILAWWWHLVSSGWCLLAKMTKLSSVVRWIVAPGVVSLQHQHYNIIISSSSSSSVVVVIIIIIIIISIMIISIVIISIVVVIIIIIIVIILMTTSVNSLNLIDLWRHCQFPVRSWHDYKPFNQSSTRV